MLYKPVKKFTSSITGFGLSTAVLFSKQALGIKHALIATQASFANEKEIAMLQVAMYDLECEYQTKIALQDLANKLIQERESYLSMVGTIKPELLDQYQTLKPYLKAVNN
jgi:hypothetical protein